MHLSQAALFALLQGAPNLSPAPLQAEKLVSALLPTKCPENHQQLQQPHLPPPQLQPEQLAAQPLHGHAEQPQEGAQEQGPQGEGAHAPPAAPQQQQQQLSGNGLVNARVRVKWIEGWFTGRVAMYMSYTVRGPLVFIFHFLFLCLCDHDAWKHAACRCAFEEREGPCRVPCCG